MRRPFSYNTLERPLLEKRWIHMYSENFPAHYFVLDESARQLLLPFPISLFDIHLRYLSSYGSIYFQEMKRPFFDKKVASCELENFSNPLFPLSNVSTTSVVTVCVCSTFWKISSCFLLPFDYIEDIRVHMNPFLFIKWSANFFARNFGCQFSV